MAYTERARTAPRRIRIRRTRIAGLVGVVVAIVARSLEWRASSSSSDTSSSTAVPHVSRGEQPGSLSETGGPDPPVALDSARLTARSRTARRCSTTGSQVSPSSTPTCWTLYAEQQPMRLVTGSGSPSTAAGVLRSTRSAFSVRRSRLRVAPLGHRSQLPGHVPRRPNARSTDAALTSNAREPSWAAHNHTHKENTNE